MIKVTVLIFIILCFLNLYFGAVKIDYLSLFQEKDSIYFSIEKLRIINLLQVVLVGASLALCGSVLQKILRNPLADPFILGISAGGTCFAASFVLLGLYSCSYFSFIDQFFPVQSIFSFIGCFFSFSFLLFFKKKVRNSNDEYAFPLIGIILNSIFSAILILLVAVAGPSQLSQIHGWLIGTMQPISVVQLCFLFLFALPVATFILKNSNQLNLLLFGDEFAKSLGVDPIRLRRRMIFGICILVSIAVSISGAVGFIGLIVPHFVKKFRRSSPLIECCLSLFVGSSLLLFADMLSRVLFSPAQLPIGVFTALLGAPAFCFILLKRRIR